jgi:hypothetical protein
MRSQLGLPKLEVVEGQDTDVDPNELDDEDLDAEEPGVAAALAAKNLYASLGQNVQIRPAS